MRRKFNLGLLLVLIMVSIKPLYHFLSNAVYTISQIRSGVAPDQVGTYMNLGFSEIPILLGLSVGYLILRTIGAINDTFYSRIFHILGIVANLVYLAMIFAVDFETTSPNSIFQFTSSEFARVILVINLILIEIIISVIYFLTWNNIKTFVPVIIGIATIGAVGFIIIAFYKGFENNHFWYSRFSAAYDNQYDIRNIEQTHYLNENGRPSEEALHFEFELHDGKVTLPAAFIISQDGEILKSTFLSTIETPDQVINPIVNSDEGVALYHSFLSALSSIDTHTGEMLSDLGSYISAPDDLPHMQSYVIIKNDETTKRLKEVMGQKVSSGQDAFEGLAALSLEELLETGYVAPSIDLPTIQDLDDISKIITERVDATHLPNGTYVIQNYISMEQSHFYAIKITDGTILEVKAIEQPTFLRGYLPWHTRLLVKEGMYEWPDQMPVQDLW